MKGFYIKKIEITGLNVQAAFMKFEKGANLVTGASDTGKSYVFSLINYALGRSTEPKQIILAAGYTEVTIEIRAFEDDETYSLRRVLGQNKIEVKNCELKFFSTSSSEKLEYKTTGNIGEKNHISYFLLSFMDFNDRKLLKNKTNGKTQNLGFSSLSKLTFVNEERIITESSPFYVSGGNSNYTVDQSLLSFLLTNNDFSEVKQKEDEGKRQTRIGGKLEYIEGLMINYAAERDKLALEYDLLRGNQNLKEKITFLKKQLDEQILNAKTLAASKQSFIKEFQKQRQDELYETDLSNRFKVLRKQYKSDLNRLNFILEADNLSSQVGDVFCPICSSSLSDNHLSHLKEIEGFRDAANEEINKINSKLVELDTSIALISSKIATIKIKASELLSEIDNISKKLTEEFSPQISDLQNQLDNFIKINTVNSELDYINKKILEISSEKDLLLKSLKDKTKDAGESIIDYSVLLEYSSFIESRLLNWKYESKIAISFNSDYKIFDILISGKPRGSYGKGKRAISLSACLLALIDYNFSKQRPFSNLIILDSPLTSFKDKGVKQNATLNDEFQIEKEIEKAFFKDLAETPRNCQVIIFDNKEPDIIEKEKMNTIIFSGEPNLDRTGFFPI